MDLLPYLPAAIVGVPALLAAFAAWRRVPKESRQLEAQRDEIMQDLGRKNTEAAAHVVDLMSGQMDEVNSALAEMKREASSLRDRTLRAEANEAKARAEAAQMMAELAAEKALRSQERHDLRNELHQALLRVSTLEYEVQVLRDAQNRQFVERRHEGGT